MSLKPGLYNIVNDRSGWFLTVASDDAGEIILTAEKLKNGSNPPNSVSTNVRT
jgi:hypothetical protein